MARSVAYFFRPTDEGKKGKEKRKGQKTNRDQMNQSKNEQGGMAEIGGPALASHS